MGQISRIWKISDGFQVSKVMKVPEVPQARWMAWNIPSINGWSHGVPIPRRELCKADSAPYGRLGCNAPSRRGGKAAVLGRIWIQRPKIDLTIGTMDWTKIRDWIIRSVDFTSKKCGFDHWNWSLTAINTGNLTISMADQTSKMVEIRILKIRIQKLWIWPFETRIHLLLAAWPS